MTPGTKTSEFKVALGAFAFALGTYLNGDLPPKYAGIVTAVISVGYAFSRGLTKAGNGSGS